MRRNEFHFPAQLMDLVCRACKRLFHLGNPQLHSFLMATRLRNLCEAALWIELPA